LTASHNGHQPAQLAASKRRTGHLLTPSNSHPSRPSRVSPWDLREEGVESGFIGNLRGLKYDYRSDITDRPAMENNFRETFESLNRVPLTDCEFARLLDEIVTANVFAAAGPRGSQRRGTSPPAADCQQATCDVTVILELFHGCLHVVADALVTGGPSRMPLTHGVSHPTGTR
jgi:hypothetical protein